MIHITALGLTTVMISTTWCHLPPPPPRQPSVHTLIELEVPFIKVGSGDIHNLPLIRTAAASNRPIVLSTGTAIHLQYARAHVCVREREDGNSYIKQIYIYTERC